MFKLDIYKERKVWQMVRILGEVSELQAPEFVFAAEERQKAAAEYAARLRNVHEQNKKDEKKADLINIACFFGGALIMAAFILTGLYM